MAQNLLSNRETCGTSPRSRPEAEVYLFGAEDLLGGIVCGGHDLHCVIERVELLVPQVPTSLLRSLVLGLAMGSRRRGNGHLHSKWKLESLSTAESTHHLPKKNKRDLKKWPQKKPNHILFMHEGGTPRCG